MTENWSPAIEPPKRTGCYLVWCINPADTNHSFLALAFWATTPRVWLEVYRGVPYEALNDVAFWQPVPKCPAEVKELGGMK